jgi:hypothetical protein
MMVSMAVVGLELLAEAHVKRADDEEGEGDAQVDEVVHGVVDVIPPPRCILPRSCRVKGRTCGVKKT